MEALTLGALAGFGIAIPVGAIAVLIVQTGIRCGFLCAAAAGAGAATADLLYAVLAIAGGNRVASSLAPIQQPLRWISAAILFAIALSGLRRLVPSPDVAAPGPPSPTGRIHTYARFLGLTVANPLTVVYFVTVVLGSGLADGLTRIQGLAFAVGAFLASLSWQTVLAATGGIARQRLPLRFHTTVSAAGHLLVLAMAALLLVR